MKLANLKNMFRSDDLVSIAKKLVVLLENHASETSAINRTVDKFFSKLSESTQNQLEDASLLLSKLFNSTDQGRASYAAIICGAIVERGYESQNLYNAFVTYYQTLLSTASPLLEIYNVAYAEQGNEDKEEETSPAEIFEDLVHKQSENYPQAAEALNRIDDLYQCGISILSAKKEFLLEASSVLKKVHDYAEINTGCSWLSLLFTVVFNEPFIILDVHAKKGIIAEVSGVVDNAQLQLLLMGLAELNGSIKNEYLEVAKGNGNQQIDTSVTAQWLMLNWELATLPDYKDRTDYWIWGEGKPTDIHKFENHRIILLEKPMYNRLIGISRTFKNLKAEVKITQTLSRKEVEDLLSKLKQASSV